MTKKGLLEKLEVRERRILRKIPDPLKEGTEYRRRYNEELFKHTEKITDVIHKRIRAFYGHITRMGPKRLTRLIFTHFQGRKFKPQWITNTEKDIEELRITEEDTKRGDPLRKNYKIRFSG